MLTEIKNEQYSFKKNRKAFREKKPSSYESKTNKQKELI